MSIVPRQSLEILGMQVNSVKMEFKVKAGRVKAFQVLTPMNLAVVVATVDLLGAQMAPVEVVVLLWLLVELVMGIVDFQAILELHS